MSLTLTEETTLGLFFIQRYRFLTIDQFARAGGLNRATARNRLRILERHSLLGHFGNAGLNGRGKTPKVYFLTRRGWDILTTESGISPDLIGNHTEVKVEARWSPQMYHRLRTVDVMISAEVAVRGRPHLAMRKAFLEYRRTKRNGALVRETTDYVDTEETSENRIVPDAAFILENIDTKKRALFFVEMDMATERIISSVVRDPQVSIQSKLSKYDRYFKSYRFRYTYSTYGDFAYFTLLFITLTEARVANIRQEMASLPGELAKYYRFTTFDHAMQDFLGPIWKSRLLSDDALYPLVREETHGTAYRTGTAG